MGNLIEEGAEDAALGFVTIAALGTVLMLAGLMFVLLEAGYSVQRTSSAYVREAQGEALADGAIHRTIGELIARKIAISHTNSELKNNDVEEWSVRTRVEPELAKVDLNLATHTNLVELLLFNEVEASAADQIAAAILDWRDLDGERRLNGAEANDYSALGRSILPRNAPFESLDELRAVLGIDEALFKKLQHQLTVYSGSFKATQLALQQLLRGERGAEFVSNQGSQVYTIVARAYRGQKPVVTRKAIVRLLTRSPERLYITYYWGDDKS